MRVFIPGVGAFLHEKINNIVYNCETGNIEGRFVEKLFKITSVDTGKSWIWTLAECEKQFGVDGFNEIHQDYHKYIVCIEL